MKSKESWAKRNPEKRKEVVRKYFLKSKEKIYERKRKWRENNPLKMKASKTNARAKRRGASGWIEVSRLEKLLINANGICEYCGLFNKNIGFDHRTPLSRGGLHELKNLSVCCAKCNRIKYNKTIPEFKKYCKAKGIKIIL